MSDDLIKRLRAHAATGRCMEGTVWLAKDAAALIEQQAARIAELEAQIAALTGKADGWKMVPAEPTETMVVCGFESWPDEHFSRPEEWAAYQAMSGCQRAAHRARLCYAAMLAAAPTDTVSPAVDAQPAESEGVRHFNYLCSLLPEGFHWSDPLTPDVMNHVVSGASAQSERLRKDAERYRWLLSQESSSNEYFRWAMHRNPQEVDSYIDEQRGEKNAKAS